MSETPETPILSDVLLPMILRARATDKDEAGDKITTGLLREAADTIATLTADLAQAKAERDGEHAHANELQAQLEAAESALRAAQQEHEKKLDVSWTSLRERAEAAEAQLHSAQQDALRAAAEAELLRTQAQWIWNTFQEAERQGYRSRERQYVLEMLSPVFAPEKHTGARADALEGHIDKPAATGA